MKKPHILLSALAVATACVCLVPGAVSAGIAQDEKPKPGAPPSEYKSKDTAAWGKTKVDAEADAPKEGEDKAKPEGLTKEECDKLKQDGKVPPPECKAADMGIVFQGGMKQKKVEIESVEQAADAESETLHERVIHFDKSKVSPREKRIRLWEVAAREPALFPGEPTKFFSAGLQVGYSSIIERGSHVSSAYNPGVNLAAEGAYQVFPMFQVALVADFEYHSGSTATGKEVIPTVNYDDAAGGQRSPRDVGAILNSYIGLGVRPTARFNINLRSLQLVGGAGIGWHYFHTSGRWRTKLPLGDRANDWLQMNQQARWNGADEAVYGFDESDSGFYYVFELAALYRFFDNRLGTGIFFKYTVPVHGAVEPEVTVEQGYGVGDSDSPYYEPSFTGYSVQENDYGDTFIRHLGSMSFVTVGLTADFRF